MGTPTLVCVWSCPNFSAPAGRPFSFRHCRGVTVLMMDDTWTKEDKLLFQSALVMVHKDMKGRWEKITKRVPGKTVKDMSAYYEALVCEVIEIESG
ncbi:transcription factor DIVARICATA-like protein [Tanacetum coccineum]